MLPLYKDKAYRPSGMRPIIRKMLLLGGILLTSFIIGSIYMFSPNHGIATTDQKSVSNDVQKFKFKDGTGNLASLVDKNGKKLDLREMDAKWQAKNLEKLAENLAKLPPRPPQNSASPLPPPPPPPSPAPAPAPGNTASPAPALIPNNSKTHQRRQIETPRWRVGRLWDALGC